MGAVAAGSGLQIHLSREFLTILRMTGLGLLCGFVALDAFVRLRMKRLGRKWVFLRGGTFDYGEYLKVRAEHGWSAWPIYILWAALVTGLALFLAGSLLQPR